MKQNCLILSSFIILFCNCNGNKDTVLKDFRKSIKIESSSTLIDPTLLGEIMEIVVFDSILLISQMNQEYIFYLFNLNDGLLSQKAIRRGRGPGEMVFPRGITKFNDTLFSTYLEHENQLYFFNIIDLFNGKNNSTKTINVDENAYRFYPINDTSLLGTGIFEQGRYCYYDIPNHNGLFYLDYPKNINSQASSNALYGQIFQGKIGIHPKNSLFVSLAGAAAILEICSINDYNINRVLLKEYYFGEYKVINGNNIAFSRDSPLSFIDVETDYNYIYTLYSGKSLLSDGNNHMYCNDLLVYDWNGSPITKIILDRQAMCLTLDRTKMMMYAYSENKITGIPEIVAYDISKI